jgi:hypothetical protein
MVAEVNDVAHIEGLGLLEASVIEEGAVRASEIGQQQGTVVDFESGVLA